jgi:hypothetical protein
MNYETATGLKLFLNLEINTMGFVEGRSKVTFIRFKNLQELEKPISWKDLSAELGTKRMPNGGRYLSRETVNSMLRMEL